MLEKAETVADMISIEERLSDVRYKIESLTSQLRNWQREVDYSTVNIKLREVEKLTEAPPDLPRTYWQQMGDGLSNTLKGIGRFFAWLFKAVVTRLPVLIILAVVAVAVIVIYRKRRKARNRQGPPEAK